MKILKKIKVSKKESDKILNKIRQADPNLKTKRIKKITFHKDFNFGMRYALCLKCGYPVYFMGLWDYPCSCCGNKKMKIYEEKHFQDFIFAIQEISEKRMNDGKE